MMTLSKKIALVTPWFSTGNGGAEVYCGGLAQALRAIGKDVEILTTCCPHPFVDWSENRMPAGTESVNGVVVRRFPVRRRDASLYAQLATIIDRGGAISPVQEADLIANSIHSDEMYDYIARCGDSTLFFFMPYMYGTTVSGVKAAGHNAFLIPCLHNEPFAYLPTIRAMFHRARGCLFLSQPERDFASAIYELNSTPQLLIGGGVNLAAKGSQSAFRERHDLKHPFALYVGRKVPGKGADLLLKYFAGYLSHYTDDELRLVMVGAGDLEIPAELHDRVLSLYYESVEHVYDAMAACEFLIQPSFYESFSLVMMEAWVNGRAVLVNGQCDVTRHHVLSSNGGLYFTSFAEFCETVRLLRCNGRLCQALGVNGRKYVETHYTWAETASRFQNFLALLG